MADWTWVPRGVEIEQIGPKVLVSELEDGTRILREKSATYKRRFRHDYENTSTVYAAQLTFLRTKDLTTSFTLIVYDPEDATPLSSTATVYLESFPNPVWVAPSRYRWEVTFREA